MFLHFRWASWLFLHAIISRVSLITYRISQRIITRALILERKIERQHGPRVNLRRRKETAHDGTVS